MKLKPVEVLHVGLSLEGKTHKVGRLAYAKRRIFFEYDPVFLTTSLEISPINLQLSPGLKAGPAGPNEGLHGVFNDSLPDGWGRLLLDRQLRQNDIEPGNLTALDRLAHVGIRGMGALTYEPDYAPDVQSIDEISLDRLAKASGDVLKGDAGAAIKELIALNGSSAGARPKAMIGVNEDRTLIINGVDQLPADYSSWLVKFGHTEDGEDTGAVEYVYSLMASEAGLNMRPTHLFPAEKGPGYFGTQRFDRNGASRLHMHTAAGLLDSDFRVPSLDYRDLIKLTRHLTRDQREVEKMFRLAVFNVFGRNRDDHAKNFSFLMDGSGTWRLSPPYDIIFSSGPGGEQSTMVMGEGKSPTKKHLRELGEIAGLAPPVTNRILDQVEAAIRRWPQLASEFGVKKATIARIQKILGV